MIPWAIRRPVPAVLAAVWLAALVVHWWWFGPALAAIALVAAVVRRDYRRRRRLALAAERQHAQLLAGDRRGIYGDYPPPTA